MKIKLMNPPLSKGGFIIIYHALVESHLNYGILASSMRSTSS